MNPAANYYPQTPARDKSQGARDPEAHALHQRSPDREREKEIRFFPSSERDGEHSHRRNQDWGPVETVGAAVLPVGVVRAVSRSSRPALSSPNKHGMPRTQSPHVAQERPLRQPAGAPSGSLSQYPHILPVAQSWILP